MNIATASKAMWVYAILLAQHYEVIAVNIVVNKIFGDIRDVLGKIYTHDLFGSD
jgi:hypothetical protein